MEPDLNTILEIDPSAEDSPHERPTAPAEKIRGWLLVPAVGLVLGALFSLVELALAFRAAPSVPDRHQVLFELNVYAELGLTAFLLYAADRFFTKRRSAPATMIALMLTSIFVNALLLAAASGADATPIATESAGALQIATIWAGIWVPYFLLSARVRRTFVCP